ncbi:LysR family transcriptional regulator [Jeongeupia naejangsanensis]|uniref:LysR family transcriptional regulator n=1 Tax=Jeongeupia naejangsanensis TaxID=613195 RepID=A0ABS2BMV8_9NEIS|nr:LysR family transcriptional regulator [Jeongeupia naejangsanensis]MBM3116770.1 LysR family transcriptional regulator [Jeongeupia naejangsanensis]
MNWTHDQLATFVAAVDAGSFSAAARRLGRAQSAVSSAIALLEASLDLTLFDRSARTPVLTDAGRALLDEARELLRQREHFENRAFALGGQAPGQITLALDEGLPYLPAMQLLADFADAYPQLTVTVLNCSAAEIAEWVADGQVDAGLAYRRLADDSAIESESVGAVPRVLVTGIGHPLAHDGKTSRKALVRHRQLIVTPRTGNEDGDERLSPQVWYSDSLYAVAELAALGVGWAVVPRNVARYPTFAGRLVALACTDVAFSALEVRLCWRTGRGDWPMLDWLRRYLSQAIFAGDDTPPAGTNR